MEGALANSKNPSLFCPETGIYSSKHPPRPLPADPFHDLPSFIFSGEHRGSTALVDSSSGSSISYPELRLMVRSMASALQNLGVSQSQVVLLLLPNTVFYPVAFLGALSVGAVATTLNPLCSPQEIRKSTKGCDLAAVFTTLDNVAKVDGFGAVVVPVPANSDYDSKKYSLFYRMLSWDADKFARPTIRQCDTGAILHSSGTSGPSKGVVLTHGNLIAAVDLFVRFEASQYKEEKSWDNVYLAALPMFHVYGLSLFVLGLLSLGSTIVVMRRFDAVEAARVMEKHNVTHFPAVPPMLGALARAGRAGGFELRRMRQVSSGAAPLSKKLIRDFLEVFPHIDLIQGYGMTESTAVGTRGFNTKTSRKYTSVGLLAPNMQAKIVDLENRSFLPPGRSGKLFLRGPGVMKGYLNNEHATLSTVDEDGWLQTGDLAYFDEDGYLYILDRLKDVIKYKGFQIAPADLEELLNSHPEIIDAGVSSIRDEEAGEIPVAFVVRKPGSKLTSEDVICYLSKQVAPYKRVREVVFLNSIPRSPAGKILRRLLHNCYGASRM